MRDKTFDYYLNLNYEVSLRPLIEDEGGGWLASIPLLSGCMSDGETPAEALANLEDAKRGWIETALALQRDIPEPDNTEKYSGKFTVPQEDGVSLNQMAIYLLALGLGRKMVKW
ncbi:type II toxin-antitoxin system HicB family antitoxin [Neomoorella thermoacetica]|uniref:type II toxin-antitoxin system HicB family antitoxin n=1 Tax=Neomoorella thermoacetica TaxID=1525 RepID=UPI0008FBA8C2|nr:type II toxin-antitoxin system HicB family antitoxin [Moorella thermoacetica]APC08577.1 hypothetical protein MTJW_14180 [Moorella thermoacetica]